MTRRVLVMDMSGKLPIEEALTLSFVESYDVLTLIPFIVEDEHDKDEERARFLKIIYTHQPDYVITVFLFTGKGFINFSSIAGHVEKQLPCKTNYIGLADWLPS